MIAYELAIYVGLMLGSFAAGYAYEATNASTIFIISTVCILAALFLMAALLPESLSTPQSVSQGFVIVDLWRTCSRSRQFVDRSILVLLMCIMLLTAFVSGKYLSRITSLLLLTTSSSSCRRQQLSVLHVHARQVPLERAAVHPVRDCEHSGARCGRFWWHAVSLVFATGQYSLVQSVDPLYSLSLSSSLCSAANRRCCGCRSSRC